MSLRATGDYYNDFTVNNFVSQGGGVYTLTVPAENHGLDINYRVSKIIRKDENNAERPVLCDYKIASNGDFTIITNEKFKFFGIIQQTQNRV